MPPTSSSRPAKRTRIACNACKQKKQRCDGMQPSCGNCAKAGRECTIENPSSKRQLPPNYIEVLEERIAQLEGMLAQVRPDMTTDHISAFLGRSRIDNTENDPSNTTQDSPIEPESERACSATDKGPVMTVQDLDPSLESLCMSSASGQLMYFGESSALSLSKTLTSVLRSVRLQGPGMTVSGVRCDLWPRMPKPLPASLPEPPFGSLLVDAYFTHVHPQYPFLHRPTFDYWERNVQVANAAGNTPDPGQAFFVYMVHAIGALIVPALSLTSVEGLHAAADLLLEQVVGLENLESIQAILCCAIYSMRSSTGVSVWTLSGIALRLCTDLGFHRRIPRANTGASTLQIQMQRRVFWVAYNLDRIAAISTGRPFGIAEEDIDVEYPEDIDDEAIVENQFLVEPRKHYTQPPTTMSLAIHNLRLRRIWADMKSSIYSIGQTPTSLPDGQIVDELKQRLRSWLAECPRPVAPDSANPAPYGSSKWFMLTYHHSVILLHRRALVAHSKQNYAPAPGMTSIYLECAESGTVLCNVYQELYFGSTISHTWGALHILFLGGLTFLYCLWVDPSCRRLYRRDVVASTCTACTVVLVIMTERWFAAQPFRDAFRVLANATQSMLAEEEERGENEPTLPVLNALTSEGMSQHLAGISGMGMCSTVEHILGEMIQQ